MSVPQQYIGEAVIQNDIALAAYTPVSTAGKLYNVAGVLYWAGSPLTGTGTVSSFSAGDLVPLFTSSVATATSTPALTFALKTTAANKVLAGPTSGADAAWAARLLVAADIPDLSATYQPLLAYTPENVANKSTSGTLGVSDTFYPSQKAVKTYADTKEPALGNPAVNGYVLSSTTLGVRSWVVQSGGGSSGHDPTASHATNAAINGAATTFMRSDAVPAIATTATLQLGSVCLGTTLVAGHLLDVYAVNSVGMAIGDLPAGTGATMYFYLPTGEIHFYSRKNHPIMFTAYDGANEVEWCRFTTAKNFLIGITNEGGLTGGGGISIGSSTDATTTGTGSIITAGGMGIAKKLYCSTIYAGATTDLTLGAGTGNQNVVLVPTGTGLLETSSNTLIGDLTANSTTAQRLLNVCGTAGVIRTVRTNSGAATVELISRTTINNTTNIAYWDFYVNSNASNLDDFSLRRRTGGADEQILNATTGQLKIVPTGDASSSTTGSLITAGGLGVAKKLYVGTDAHAVGVLYGDSTTDSSSSVTGGTIIAGGVGIAKQLYVGTGLNVAGPVTFVPAARTSGVAAYFTITAPADTGQTTTAESIGVNFATATRTWADGTVALQRERVFSGLTYNKTTTAATFTEIFNLYLTPPIAGTGVTFTRGHTLGIVDATSAVSSITGGLVISAALGTAATSIGFGGGNINAGGTITAGGVIYAGSGPTTLTDAAGKILAAALNAVPLGGLATIANNTILGNISGVVAVPSALTGANVRTICGLATTDAVTFGGLTLAQAVGGATVFAVDMANAYAGTGTATTGAPRLYLGKLSPSGDDAALCIGRIIAGDSLFSHAIRDESTFVSTTTGGYASFDAQPNFNGTIHYNHLNCFQARPIYSGSGNIDAAYGFTCQLTNNGSGHITQAYGLYVFNPLGTGPIDQFAGIYIASLTTPTATYAIYSPGASPVYFGGNLQINGTLVGVTNLGLGTGNVYNTLTGVGNAGFYSSWATSVGTPVGASIYLGDSNFNAAGYYNSAPGISAAWNVTSGLASDLAFYYFAGVSNARSEAMRIDNTGKLFVGSDVVLSYNSSYMAWQGSSALIGRGLMTQKENQVGLMMLGVGTGKDTEIFGTAARGSFGALAALQANDSMLNIYAGAYDGTAWGFNARISFFAAETQAVGAHGQNIGIDVTPIGSASRANAAIFSSTGLLLAGSLTTGAPAGGTAATTKHGQKNASTLVALDAQNWLEEERGGVLYRLALITITTP